MENQSIKISDNNQELIDIIYAFSINGRSIFRNEKEIIVRVSDAECLALFNNKILLCPLEGGDYNNIKSSEIVGYINDDQFNELSNITVDFRSRQISLHLYDKVTDLKKYTTQIKRDRQLNTLVK